jgi:hypothetical protein
MNPRKPGRIFWIFTFAVGVFSPGSGKRRIGNRMQELHQGVRSRDKTIESLKVRNSELTSENNYLRRRLGTLAGEKNLFLVQDEMNAALNLRTEQWTGTTMPLTVVN